jgi:radical SAM superfamily enzyme YgiQ (UPF0313 family)
MNILLLLLPYWTPLIPPMGISCLKSYLQRFGYCVKTDDANTLDVFKKIYTRYFDILREAIPGDKRGNFFSIGHDVLENHLTAYLHRDNETGYLRLVKTLVFKTFYCSIDDRTVKQLNETAADFYDRLEQYILDLLEKEKPTVFGLSVNSCVLPASLFAFRLVKKKNPLIKTVMGGGVFCDHLALGTPNFETLLETSKGIIDHIIIGEGEVLFLKLLQGEFPQNQRVITPADINRETLDISTADVPDFSDLNLDLYPYLSSYTSRSCPFQCRFCSDSVMWGKYRKKTAKQVVEEMAFLAGEYNYQLFMLSDLLLNPVMSELSGAFIRLETAVYWDGCIRADKDVCSIENTQLWRRGGFYKARLGIESGSPRVLKLMGKKVNVEQIKEAIASLAFAGIQTTTLWIVGFPGETEEDFLQTLTLIEELKDDIYEAECRPFYYYPSGQVGSDQWERERNRMLLYPEETQKLLPFQTWLLDGMPTREETYRRVNRFVRHCSRLGIPNIYSLHDIYTADTRWKKLHKNAVPPLLEFKQKRGRITECKHFESSYFIQNTVTCDDDFNF